MTRLSLVVLLALAAPALADPVPRAALIVGRAAAGAAYRDGPTLVTLGADAELAVVLVAREKKRTVYLVPDGVSALVIGGRAVRSRDLLPFPEARVRWSHVEPHAWRPEGEVAPNGTTTSYYSNVVTGGDKHGQWLGYDRVVYFETPLGEPDAAPAARRRPATARPTRLEDDVTAGLGTLRYRVEVELADGAILSTPGMAATDGYGILPTVHRVTVRKDDTYLGQLSGYFLVPEVFGSAGPGRNHQTDRYVGADCADVLVGALRAMGKKTAYTSVAGLPELADVVAGPGALDEKGAPVGAALAARPGDMIRINYGGEFAGETPREWDHVVVLWEDRSDPAGPAAGGPDGTVDGFDLVVHVGHPRVLLEPLAPQAPATIDVLRWNAKKTK